jgi:hypothetical protein
MLVERLDATPDSESTAQDAFYIGELLLLLLRHRFDDTTLDRAATLLQNAATAVPSGHPTQLSAFQALAELWRLRFEHHREVTDLGHAVRLGESLLDVIAPTHRARPYVTADLGWTLVLRARQTNTATDLDAGLDLIEAALAAMRPEHEARADTLLRLSKARRFRYESGWGDRQDLTSAIQAVSEAWQLPMTTSEHVRALVALGALRMLRFQLLGDPSDLDEAVDTGRAALELLGDDVEAAEDWNGDGRSWTTQSPPFAPRPQALRLRVRLAPAHWRISASHCGPGSGTTGRPKISRMPCQFTKRPSRR